MSIRRRSNTEKNQLLMETTNSGSGDISSDAANGDIELKLRRYWTPREEERFFEIWGRENWRITRYGKNTIHFANWAKELKDRWAIDVKPEEVQTKVNQTRAKFRQVMKQHENDPTSIRWKKFEVIESILKNQYRPADAPPVPPELLCQSPRDASSAGGGPHVRSPNGSATNAVTAGTPLEPGEVVRRQTFPAQAAAGGMMADEIDLDVKPNATDVNLSGSEAFNMNTSSPSSYTSEFISDNIDFDQIVVKEEESSEDPDTVPFAAQAVPMAAPTTAAAAAQPVREQQTPPPRVPVMVANTAWEQQLQEHIQQNLHLKKPIKAAAKKVPSWPGLTVVAHPPQTTPQQQPPVRLPIVPIPAANMTAVSANQLNNNNNNNQQSMSVSVVQRAPVAAQLAAAAIVNNCNNVINNVANNNVAQNVVVQNTSNNVAGNSMIGNNIVNTAGGNVVVNNVAGNNIVGSNVIGNSVAGNNVLSNIAPVMGNNVTHSIGSNNATNNIITTNNISNGTNRVPATRTPSVHVRKRSAAPRSHNNNNKVSSVTFVGTAIAANPAATIATTTTTASASATSGTGAFASNMQSSNPVITIVPAGTLSAPPPATQAANDPHSLESLFLDEVRKKNLILAEQNEIARKRLFLEERKVSLMEKFFPNCLQMQADILQKLNKQ